MPIPIYWHYGNPLVADWPKQAEHDAARRKTLYSQQQFADDAANLWIYSRDQLADLKHNPRLPGPGYFALALPGTHISPDPDGTTPGSAAYLRVIGTHDRPRGSVVQLVGDSSPRSRR